jgi:hypothetical protein
MADAWGENNWGEGFWGQQSSITVSVTGVSSSTIIENVNSTGTARVLPTGSEAPAEVGQAIGEAESIYPLTGVEAPTQTGTVSIGEGHGVQPTGVSLGFTLDTETKTFNTVGDAALSTDQFKFGGSSLELDGAGDYIKSNRDYTLGLGDFTFETFARFNVLSGFQYIWDASENVGANDSPILYVSATNIVFKFGGGASQIDVAHGMSVDTFHHIAVTRDGRDYEVFIDGSSVGTATDSQDRDIPSTFYTIGASASGGLGVNGYLDEIRISTTVRYTSNFTPTTTEFTTDSDTLILLHFDGADGSTDIVDSASPFVVTTVDAGWGRSTWGSFAWNNNITRNVALTGQQIDFGQSNVSVFTGTGIVANATGIEVSSDLGSVALSTDQILSVTGLESQSSLALATIIADGSVTTSAPADIMDMNVGSVSIDIFTQVDPTAVTSTFDTGTLAMTGDANFTLTGAQANTTLGTATTQTGTGVNVATTGVSMQFDDGTANTAAGAIVQPTGLEMSVVLGNMRSTPWANVVTGASNTWTEVAA